MTHRPSDDLLRESFTLLFRVNVLSNRSLTFTQARKVSIWVKKRVCSSSASSPWSCLLRRETRACAHHSKPVNWLFAVVLKVQLHHHHLAGLEMPVLVPHLWPPESDSGGGARSLFEHAVQELLLHANVCQPLLESVLREMQVVAGKKSVVNGRGMCLASDHLDLLVRLPSLQDSFSVCFSGFLESWEDLTTNFV